MNRRSILRAAPLVLAAAALAAACSEQLPSGAARGPLSPRGVVTPTNAFSAIDGGQTHACGITSGGQAWCYGRNSFGQLGDSTATNSSVAVATLQNSLSFTQITAGEVHTCALVSSGQAYCWGSNADGRLGDSTTTLPLKPVAVHPIGAFAFTTLSAGSGHTCGLDSSGNGYCWGGNSNGQLGNNSSAFAKTPVAVQMPGGVSFTQIQAGYWQTCALATGGQAYCWGYGGDGALGYGFTVGDSVPQAVTQSGGLTFASIYTEYKHTCALTSGGLAYCWGLNTNSQLGDSTTTRRYTPTAARMPSGVTYTKLALGSANTCGLSGAGQAYCWGAGTNGQLGNGSFANSRLPVAVSQPAGVTFTDIRAEGLGFCGLDTVGQTWCWGQNIWGQLGNNSTTNSATPVAVVH